MPTRLSPFDELMFQKLFRQRAEQTNTDPNPDEPLQFYDARAAFANSPGEFSMGHLPSTYKKIGNDRYFLNGIDTTQHDQATSLLLDLLTKIGLNGRM